MKEKYNAQVCVTLRIHKADNSQVLYTDTCTLGSLLHSDTRQSRANNPSREPKHIKCISNTSIYSFQLFRCVMHIICTYDRELLSLHVNSLTTGSPIRELYKRKNQRFVIIIIITIF